jgi:hypothetical protein
MKHHRLSELAIRGTTQASRLQQASSLLLCVQKLEGALMHLGLVTDSVSAFYAAFLAVALGIGPLQALNRTILLALASQGLS